MLASAFDFQVGDICYNITSTTDHTVEVASGSSGYLGDIVIPDHVTYNGVDFLVNGIQKGKCVGAYGGYTSLKFEGGAFTSSGITSIVIPATITEIGDATFAHCSSLKSITFPNTLTKITGRGAFYGTSSLSEVTLPDALTEIGFESFWGSGITSLTIGPNIKKGGYNAFKYCSNLEVINVPNIAAWCQIDFEEGSYMSHPFEYAKELRINGEKVTDIVIDSSIPKIGTMCFYKYEGLKSIKFEAGIKSIGNYAFFGCSGLEELVFPNELNTIGNYAFEGCSSIKKIRFSRTINNIGTSAFKDCNNIELIESSIMKPMETAAFTNSTYMFTPLYVPEGTSNLYKNTSGWSNFSTIIEKEELGVYKFKLTYMVDGEEYKSYFLEYGAQITPEPDPVKEGYTFSGWSEIPATMPDYDVVVTGTFTKNPEENNTDEINGHKYVDLGLPSGKCWATTNYGADTPEGYGSYMDWTNNSAISTNWGTGWTTPSVDDILELKDNCTWTWESYNGINGFKVTGKNGNYIFLPASGYKMLGENAAKKVGDWAYYWSSTSANGMAYIIMGTSAEIGYGQMNTSMTYLPIRPITMDSQNSSEDDWTFDGEGTKESPYQIKSPSDLIKLASLTNSGKLTETFYFCMTNNIDMTEIAFTPIGNKNYSFYGNFDGNGFVIKGLTIDSSSEVGLFGYTNGATICNIGIEEADFRSTNYVGGIVGYSSGTIIMNCYTQGSISGDFCAGGLVGYGNMLTKIKNCYSSIQHTMTEIQGYVGGLVGYNCGALENCYFSGSINATSYDSSKTGGIMGYYYVLGDVNNCFFIKTSGVNEQLDYYGGCNESYRLGHYDTFDENGITSSGSSLYKLLNTWVTKEQGDYKKWTEEAFPSFVGFNGSSGIAPLPINNSKEITGIYNLQGHKLERLIKGVNIIKYKNGTTKKVIKQ